MFLIISKWLKDKKSQAKVRKFLTNLDEKYIILLLWEILESSTFGRIDQFKRYKTRGKCFS